MLRTLNSSAHAPSIPILVGIAAALIAGMMIGLQPIISGVLILVVAFGVLLTIHPLAAFTGMLILAPLRTLIETESPFRLPLDIGQINFLALALIWCIYRIARGERLLRFEKSAALIPLAVFFAAVSLTVFSAASVGAWLSEWLKWGVALTLVVLILNVQRYEWLLFGLITAGIGNALVGLYIFLGGSGALHLLIPNSRYFRAFGTFGQPNPFGGFMGLLAPLALGAALGYALRTWQTWRITRRFTFYTAGLAGFYFAACGILSLGVIISWSRGAWLGFVIALVVVIVAIPRKWWQSALLMVVIVGLGLTLWFSGRLPASIVERVNSATSEIFAPSEVRGVDITSENWAVVERLAHWQAALNMAREYPWLGVGMGNYEVVYPQYRLINWAEPLGHAHNYYLNVFAEAGIIGLTAYATLWLSVLWMSWRTRRHPDMLARFVAVGLVGTWIYLTIHSLTDNLYVNNMFLHIGVMLGILAVLHNQTLRSVRLEKTWRSTTTRSRIQTSQ